MEATGPTEEQMTTVDEAISRFKSQEIDFNEFQQILHTQGARVNFWDPRTEPHPMADGNNRSRSGMKWHPNMTRRGEWFQRVAKEAMRKTISFAWNTIVKKYDEEAFIYEDNRLLTIKDVCYTYFDKNFTERDTKNIMMKQLLDVVLFLMKEDIYYRGRFFEMLNELPIFEISENERNNIEKWH